jgi:subtilisin-like proprotein convertase family protein
MKTKFIIIAIALFTVIGAHAALVTLSSGTLNTAVPDGNVNGLQSTLTFNDAQFTSILDVNVRLNISGGYNGDLYVYLTHGSGFSVLLNRTGRTGSDAFGYGDAGFSITLDDAASSDIHNYGGNGGAALTGTWQPDARNVNPATALNTDPRTAFLSAFNGLDPNGSWTLFVADMVGGDQSTLVSWELDITAVPEPTTVALGIFGGLLAAGAGLRLWRRRRG